MRLLPSFDFHRFSFLELQQTQKNCVASCYREVKFLLSKMRNQHGEAPKWHSYLFPSRCVGNLVRMSLNTGFEIACISVSTRTTLIHKLSSALCMVLHLRTKLFLETQSDHVHSPSHHGKFENVFTGSRPRRKFPSCVKSPPNHYENINADKM